MVEFGLKMVEWLQSGKFVDEKVHIHVAADDVAVENGGVVVVW